MKILFVCASNVCRSPYCEYVFRDMVQKDPILRDKVKIKSAAVLNRMKKINEKTRRVLIEDGFDADYVDSHKPSYLYDDPQRFEEADIIIGMTKFQKFLLPKKYKKKYITLSEAAIGKYEQIPDPWLIKDFDEYRSRMEIIKGYLDKYFDKLKKEY
ncbi:MAG: hypothetical protein Q4E28_01710 [Clostridia bacterium]|nr:hypothetical protein [Clostridia bacterium]